MKEISEQAAAKANEMKHAAETMEHMANPAEAAEQREMEAFRSSEISDEMNREQQEMDAFTDEKLGMKTIYYPDGDERGGRDPRLGEYRIFCDTRPTVSSYDIFCDGR